MVVPVVVYIPLLTCDEHQAVVEQLGQVVTILPEIYYLFLLPFLPSSRPYSFSLSPMLLGKFSCLDPL